MDPDDEDEFSMEEKAAHPNLGLDFFSQPPSFGAASSFSGGHGTRRRNGAGEVDGLDLNSQAVDFQENMSFLELLRSPASGVVGDGERGGADRAVVHAAGRGAGVGHGNLRSTWSGKMPNNKFAIPSRTAGAARRRGSGTGRGSGARPPVPPAPQQFRAPRPTIGRSKLGATASAGDGGFSAGLHEHDTSGWSQNPYDEEADDVQVQYASMKSSSSDDEDESDENSSSGDDETKITALNQLELLQQFGAVACMFGMYYESTFMNETKKLKTGHSGYQWVMTTLDNPTACYNMFRMSRELFYRLHDELVRKYGLRSSNKMGSVESLAMFLWIVGAPQSVRQAENRFERSTETVSRKFHDVLNCVSRLSVDIIKPRDPQFRTVHPRLQSSRFSPHFDNCIGAIDGTHIPVVVPASKVAQYVGRYGYTTQNVLAICDFDMRFTFVVAGWPGSVHDTRVFNDALNKYNDDFPHPPPGKFYLVDSGTQIDWVSLHLTRAQSIICRSSVKVQDPEAKKRYSITCTHPFAMSLSALLEC